MVKYLFRIWATNLHQFQASHVMVSRQAALETNCVKEQKLICEAVEECKVISSFLKSVVQCAVR